MTTSRHRVAVVFYNIGPYHHARLNAAAKWCRIIALEWSAREAYPWGQSNDPPLYEKISLFPDAEQDARDSSHLREMLAVTLKRINPDVVAVNGWNDFGSLSTIWCCQRAQIPMLVMSESSKHDESRVWSKEYVKSRIIRVFSAALVGGSLHANYLRQLGMVANHIFTGYDVVDNKHFVGEARMEMPDTTKHFLASSRFVEKKNLPMLLRAYAAYRNLAGKGAWGMTLLGDGPLRGVLQDLIIGLGLEDSVTLPGFIQYDELPGYYLKASAFVHASTTEQWGLVVNEALASGLPVIVSNRCGCVPELVHENENGFTFDPMDQNELASCLLKMTLLCSDERGRYREASRQIVANHAPAAFGEGLMNAATTALKLPVKSAGLFDRFLLRQLLHQ